MAATTPLKKYPIPPLFNFLNGGSNTALNNKLDSFNNIFKSQYQRPFTQTYYSPGANVNYDRNMGQFEGSSTNNGVSFENDPSQNAINAQSRNYVTRHGGSPFKVNNQELEEEADAMDDYLFRGCTRKAFIYNVLFMSVFVFSMLFAMTYYITSNDRTPCDLILAAIAQMEHHLPGVLRYARVPVPLVTSPPLILETQEGITLPLAERPLIQREGIISTAVQDIADGVRVTPVRVQNEVLPNVPLAAPVAPNPNAGVGGLFSSIFGAFGAFKSWSSKPVVVTNTAKVPVGFVERTIPVVPQPTRPQRVATEAEVGGRVIPQCYTFAPTQTQCSDQWSYPSAAMLRANPLAAKMRFQGCSAQCERPGSIRSKMGNSIEPAGLPNSLTWGYGVCVCSS